MDKECVLFEEEMKNLEMFKNGRWKGTVNNSLLIIFEALRYEQI